MRIRNHSRIESHQGVRKARKAKKTKFTTTLCQLSRWLMRKWWNMLKVKEYKTKSSSKAECQDRSATFWVRPSWSIEPVSHILFLSFYHFFIFSIETWRLEPRWLLVTANWSPRSNLENRKGSWGQGHKTHMAEVPRIYWYNWPRLVFWAQWERFHRKIRIWIPPSNNPRRGRKLEGTQRLANQSTITALWKKQIQNWWKRFWPETESDLEVVSTIQSLWPRRFSLILVRKQSGRTSGGEGDARWLRTAQIFQAQFVQLFEGGWAAATSVVLDRSEEIRLGNSLGSSGDERLEYVGGWFQKMDFDTTSPWSMEKVLQRKTSHEKRRRRWSHTLLWLHLPQTQATWAHERRRQVAYDHRVCPVSRWDDVRAWWMVACGDKLG